MLSLSAMPRTLDPELRRALAARIRYYNEMGIYDFYRQPLSDRAGEVAAPVAVDEEDVIVSEHTLEPGEEMSPRKAAAVAMPVAIEREENIFEAIALKPEQSVSDPVKALRSFAKTWATVRAVCSISRDGSRLCLASEIRRPS